MKFTTSTTIPKRAPYNTTIYQIQSLATPNVFGSIFAPMKSKGPCTSCGNSK